ncbi:hypothetical protein [Flavobacterium sp. GT3P67]|uniref:hypothetical protein n=1 Tax=Flavobacterium sp. GT3P67 TaxID=2541722 RepID=UPI00104C793B|nr:hypothetical protein [Flavobacterium sp. GT3P67]TDE53798.1 hypothetical protein E0H99_07210 [Flavobacterium sp. GT3P67]
MNRIILLLITIIFFGCSSNDDAPKESYSFENRTDYNVTISPYDSKFDNAPDFEFKISPNEKKTYSSEYIYTAFKIKSSESIQNFTYKSRDGVRVIYSFHKALEYKITGTSKSADITYVGSNGETHQETVPVPYTVSYNQFGNDFKYISAQNNDKVGGGLTVELFIEDNLISSKTCGSFGCIVTAQN